MATEEQGLSLEQKELVAVGASVGVGCQPCVDHHLKAGAKAGLDGGQLLAAVAGAERVAAEAAVLMGDRVRGKLGPSVAEPTLLSRLEEALASLGAAIGANDATNIERQLRAALELGGSRPQLEQAIETAKTVQESAARIHLREAERLLDALAVSVAPPENEAESSDGCGCGQVTRPSPRPRRRYRIRQTRRARTTPPRIRRAGPQRASPTRWQRSSAPPAPVRWADSPRRWPTAIACSSVRAARRPRPL